MIEDVAVVVESNASIRRRTSLVWFCVLGAGTVVMESDYDSCEPLLLFMSCGEMSSACVPTSTLCMVSVCVCSFMEIVGAIGSTYVLASLTRAVCCLPISKRLTNSCKLNWMLTDSSFRLSTWCGDWLRILYSLFSDAFVFQLFIYFDADMQILFRIENVFSMLIQYSETTNELLKF